MGDAFWTPAYVGLGSNLEDPSLQIRRGFAALARLPDTRLVARSRLYRSRPLGPVEQPDFVNAVAGLLTRKQPEALLQALKKLEQELGRAQPVVRWGPRIIDLDLLLYGHTSMSSEALTLPHPGLPERNWVLYPLSEIAPSLEVPGYGHVQAMAQRLGTDGLETLPSASEQP